MDRKKTELFFQNLLSAMIAFLFLGPPKNFFVRGGSRNHDELSFKYFFKNLNCFLLVFVFWAVGTLALAGTISLKATLSTTTVAPGSLVGVTVVYCDTNTNQTNF